jgi:hypothetical protein
VGFERVQHGRPRLCRVTVTADRRESRREVRRLPRQYEPVDPTQESQRHGVLVRRVEPVV